MGLLFFALTLSTCLQGVYGSSKAAAEDPLALAARVGPGSTHDKIATSLSSDHMHVTQEDINTLLGEHLILQRQYGALDVSKLPLGFLRSQDAAISRTLINLMARSEPSRSPISLDLAFYHEELAGAILPYLGVRHEEKPFRLTHLGLHASVLSSLAQSPEAARAFTQNTGLTSLRLYGLLKTCDFLTLFPHLTHLDTSQARLTGEAAAHLVEHVHGMPSLRSFKAPSTQTQDLGLSILETLGLASSLNAHLTALKQIEENLRQASIDSGLN